MSAESHAPPATHLDSPRLSFSLTVILALIALSWQLGVRNLNEPDEGRYASVAVGMLRSGDWIVPQFQGAPHLTKPPLIYWLTAFSLKCFGVNAWAARLVPALAAFGTVLLTWLLAFRWMDARRALYAALMLLTAPLFFLVARLCDPNMLLTFFVTLGSWAWVSWQEEGKRSHLWLYYFAHGFAFMTKGPVGCVIILLGQLAFRCAGANGRRNRRIWHWGGFLLALAMGLAWYVLMILQQPGRLDYFLRYELFDRVFTNVHKRSEPFWFFFAVLPVAFLPWLPILASIVKRGWKTVRTSYPEGPLVFHILFILVLFSISRSKLPTYILPALPPLALLTAAQMRFDETLGRHFLWSKRLVTLLAILLPVILIIIGHVRLQASHLLHGSTALSTVFLLALLFRMRQCPPHRWLLPAAAILFVAYASALDLVRRDERAMFGESTAQFVKEWLALSRETPPALYFTHSPAGLLFYLPAGCEAKRLELVKTKPKLSVEEYLAQLRAHLESLRGQQAFVMVNSSYMDRAPKDDPLPGHLFLKDRKYSIWQSP